MGSFSRPRPFLHIHHTVDACYALFVTKTNFSSCILHLGPPSVGNKTVNKMFMVGIDG